MANQIVSVNFQTLLANTVKLGNYGSQGAPIGYLEGVLSKACFQPCLGKCKTYAMFVGTQKEITWKQVPFMCLPSHVPITFGHWPLSVPRANEYGQEQEYDHSCS